MLKEQRTDLINRNALLAELDKFANPMPNKSGYEFLHGIATAITEIEDSPAVDAVEVVHGEWRKVYTCHREQAWGYEGNQCKADNPRATYYCPNCGAKMDGGSNNE